MIEEKRKKKKHNLHQSFLKTKSFSFFLILMFLFLTNNDKIIVKIIIKKLKQ
jgi:hypothetical protein